MENDFIASKWEKQRIKLAEMAFLLPDAAGVYFMHDGEGNILYIGKAGSLKKRVGSYFRKSTDVGPWKEGMLTDIDHFETLRKGCPKRKSPPYSGQILISVRKKVIRFDADLDLFFH